MKEEGERDIEEKVDPKKADLNKDGELSDYEEARADAAFGDGADEDADDPEVQEGLDEDALTAMVEKLVVDMAQRKTGHLGVSEDTAKYELERILPAKHRF